MQRSTSGTTHPDSHSFGHSTVAEDLSRADAQVTGLPRATSTVERLPRATTTVEDRPAGASTVDALDEAFPATVSTAIADVIVERADHVFGLVGNANSHVVSHLTVQGFPYTATRHEAGAVAAADAFHRAGGGIAVATTTCGAGFTNTITPLAEANAARVPMVYVTGSAPAAGARHFDLDQAALLEAMGIDYFVVSPATAAADAHAAFTLAESRRVPVVLLVPFDEQNRPLSDDGAVVSRPDLVRPAHAVLPAPAADPEGLARIAELLAGAERPLILSGRGVVAAGAADAVAELGDVVGALHMHSAMARNVIGGEWCMGTAGGFTHRGYLEYTRSADVVLILGASFNAFQSRGGGLFAPDATIAQVVLEEHSSSLPVGLRVLADVGAAAPALVESVRALRDASAPTWRDELGALPPAEDREKQPELFHDYGADGRLDPRAALRRLNGMMPARRTVCTDGGHFLGWVPMYLDSPDPHAQVLVGTAIQTIGLGFPTAIGVAAARPDDFNVLVTGDGGGLMAMAEAETVFRTVRRGAVIFMNDAAYGAELHQYRAEGLDTASMVIDDIDFAAMGRSLGARGVTVSTVEDFALVAEELAAMDTADNPGVLVIDLKISREVIADFIAEVLKKQ